MDQRKPLSTRSNLSRLPLPGGAPKTLKRSRSPDEDASAEGGRDKKSRLDTSVVQSVRRLPPSKSVSNLGAAGSKTAPRLKRGTSSSNLMKKPTGPAPVTSRNISTVMPAKNSRPIPKPAPNTTNIKSRVNTGIKSEAANGLNSTVVSTGVSKKRPAWDLKGRLQDMEANMQKHLQGNSFLQNQLSEYNNRIAQLEGQNQKLSGDVQEKAMASESALKEIQDLKQKLSTSEQEHECEKKHLKREIEDIKFEKSTLERQKTSLKGELEASMKEVSGLKSTVAELTASQSTIKAELENTKMRLEAALKTIDELNKTVSEKNKQIQNFEEEVSEYQRKERCHETERRKLHNTIQELKGNIRVFCRVRPLLGEEQLGNDGIITHMNFPDIDHKSLVLDKLAEMSVNESVMNSTRGGSRAVSKYEFNFDKVFQPESSQADVFEEISQLVQSALDGYNVCIFAYGQTGSGKTFTMEGSLNDDSNLGMIPRTVQQIFTAAKELESKGWQYKFEASMLEIYNETIRDLLGKNSKSIKHEIKMCGKGDGEVYVSNLTVMDVSSEDKVLNLLRKASENRAVAETKCNERSSRSHSVFQLKLTGTNSITGESSKGILNLVDLAGSERVKDSGSEGQRMIEAQNINSSLSCLGNVIMALGNKEKHIPYRNSKLTYLLQNSLGGNSKTLMFVNISPKEECFSETLNSLRFATKVNQCNIGTAQKKK